jgi:glycosyltransferase involved in cell wall biosynthesis
MPIHRPSVIQQFARVSARAAAAWQPDVCHAHDLNALLGAARVARQQDALLVYDSHELWRRRNRHGELRPLGRLVDALQERRLIRRVDMVITVSPGIRDWLQRQYRLAVPVEAVRNLPLRRQHRDGPPLRELAGVGDERVLMYTGRITSGRGLEETVNALPGLPEDVVLVMLGYGDDLFVRQLHHRADRRGVAHRVRQVPPVTPDQVPAVASQADCALVAIEPVCLSYYFALPNKLFEAVQAGLPVLASDLPDMRTIVDGYQVGRLFQTGRPGEVRDGISALLADLDLYKENADRAAAELTWEHESEVLRHAYARLTGRAAAMHQAA